MAAAKKTGARKRAATKTAKTTAKPRTNPVRDPQPDEPNAPKLDDAHRAYVVRRIACFDTPSEVAAGLKDDYGVEISRQSVEYYDPEKNPRLAPQWKAMHAAAREAFLTETAKEPAAERAYRVRRLARMARTVEGRGNVALAKELYKQIAEEMGGKFTNKLEHSGIPAMPTAVTVTLVDPKERPGG